MSEEMISRKVAFDRTMKVVHAAIDATHNGNREVVAQWMIRHGFSTGHGDTIYSLLSELSWQVEELKKEAKAIRLTKICR